MDAWNYDCVKRFPLPGISFVARDKLGKVCNELAEVLAASIILACHSLV